MNTPNTHSRRIFLQRAGLATIAVAGGSSFLAGCASGGGDKDSVSGGGAEKSAENPFGVKATDALAVVIFNGGYGDEYAKFHESLYTDQYAEEDRPQGDHRHPPADAAALQRRQPA